MTQCITLGIAGIDGYVGKTLVKLIAQHPHLKIVATIDRNALHDIENFLTKFDVLLLATPAEISLKIIASLKNTQIKIIDLSGAFRLPENTFEKWYGIKHEAPELLTDAVYGLSPWENIGEQHKIVANPGCYATCVLMSLIPLLQANIINSENIVIDAKSGVSGAGKSSNPDLMFGEMAQNFFPYKIGKHQHIPEIKNALLKYTEKSCSFTFMTHVLPIQTGIAMTIYADAIVSAEPISNLINSAYKEAYQNYEFVKFEFIKQGDSVKEKTILSLKNVVNTPNIHIGFFVDQGKVIIFACMDNLYKGAASQAIENINRLYGLPLETGLQNRGEII